MQQDENNGITCPWYIKSVKHFNCFWIYVKDKSNVDGSMHEHTQSEIADLMGWSNTKTHFMLKEATAELLQVLEDNDAKKLLEETSSDVITINPDSTGSNSQDE